MGIMKIGEAQVDGGSQKTGRECAMLALLVLAACVCAPASALSLPDAIDKALEFNPAVRAALHDRDAARYTLRAARGGYSPRLDVEYGYARAELDDRFTRLANTQSDAYERRDASAQITQTLFDGLEVYHRVEGASARLDGARQAAHATADDLALNTAGAYLEVLRRQRTLALAQENLEAHRRIRSLIRRRSEGGVSRGSDDAQAESRLALAVSTVRQEQAAVEDAEATFLRFTGMSAAGLFEPTSPAGYLPVAWQGYADEGGRTCVPIEAAPDPSERASPAQDDATALPVDGPTATGIIASTCSLDQGRQEAMWQSERAAYAQVLADTLPRHPRILAAKARVAAARSAVGVARSAYAPRITLEVVGARSENRIDDEITDVEAGVRARWNLFNGTSDWNNAGAAQADLERAEEELRQAEIEVTESLAQSASSLTSSRDRVIQLRRYANAMTTAQGAYMRQYSIGQRSLLDLVNAQNEVFSARTQLVAAELAEIFSAYRVLAAMGTLMPAMGIKLPSGEGYAFRRQLR